VEANDNPKGFGQRLSHTYAWLVVQSARILVMFSLLPLFSPTRALAQTAPIAPPLADMTIEELMLIHIDSVYGASGYQQKVTEAPASITIITSDEIQRYGYRTLADILRNVTGFYVSYDRNYSYLGVRGYGLPGQYNSSITLLIDGHRLNDNIFDSALIGTEFPLDIDMIDRVEVIRGPNSSLYVASDFLGVINVIKKRARDLPNVSATGSTATYGTHEGHIS
jgi:outer membrane receptor for ferrienterochelin and colicins